jgi:hypothetical protein
MKRHTILSAFAALLVFAGLACGQRINRTLTVSAGTPVNVGQTLMTGSAVTTAIPQSVAPVWASRMSLQALLAANGGVVYVMGGISYGRIPSASGKDLTVILAAGTSTAPGGFFSDSDPTALIDLNGFWIDGAHTGDTVQASCVPKL